jgi:hypothetical protein
VLPVRELCYATAALSGHAGLALNLFVRRAAIEPTNEETVAVAALLFPGTVTPAEIEDPSVTVGNLDLGPLAHRPGLAGIGPLELQAPSGMDYRGVCARSRQLHAIDAAVGLNVDPTDHRAGGKKRGWRHQACADYARKAENPSKKHRSLPILRA